MENKMNYMYFVEYYCQKESDRLFKLDREKEFKKFSTELTREDFLSNGGYVDSFIFSEDYINKKAACDFAKKQSKKNNDMATVGAGWYSKNEWDELELEEIDENFFKRYINGVKI